MHAYLKCVNYILTNKRELLKTRKIKNKKGIISLRGTERSVSFRVSS